METMSSSASASRWELDGRAVGALAAVSATSVANCYYIQPLLGTVGTALALPQARLGLLPAVFQLGLAVGICFLLPLADVITARKLLAIVVPLQIAALLLIAASSNVELFAIGCIAAGLFGITPYVLPPYASLHVPASRIGRVTGMLTSGVICGILLARTVAGLVAVHYGWRTVYALAACAMIACLGVILKEVKPSLRPKTAAVGYRYLIQSLIGLFTASPTLRTAAYCQALSFGSFNVFWLGSALYLHDRFGWRPDQIGYVALLGAAAAVCAPLFGRLVDRVGPQRTRPAALATIVVAWALLALCRDSLLVMAIALVMLDLGSTVTDISNRSILYGLAHNVRTRLNALYTIAMFVGGAALSIGVGICWATGGWLAVCALGAISAALSMILALSHVSDDGG
jgi:predicted MFS family arabinose efflux permease